MIRPPTPRDQSYIASTWTRSLLAQHAADRDPAMRTYAQISALVDATLDRKDTRAAVCVDPHDHDFIWGWMLYAADQPAPVIHYLYLRQSKRGSGLSGQLLGHIGVSRQTAVVCTSLGPSSRLMRGMYRSSAYFRLAEFLG